MPTVKKLVAKPAPALQPEEQWAIDHARWEPNTVRSLQYLVDRGKETREAFCAKILKRGPGELARAVAWGESEVKADHEAKYAAGVLAHYAGDGSEQPVGGADRRGRLEQALRHYRDDFTRRLLGDHLRANSTGPFHRADESTERAAIASLRERFEWFLRDHDEIAERGRKLGGAS